MCNFIGFAAFMYLVNPPVFGEVAVTEHKATHRYRRVRFPVNSPVFIQKYGLTADLLSCY